MDGQSAAGPYGDPLQSVQGPTESPASVAVAAVGYFPPSLHGYVVVLVLSLLRAGGSYFCIWP